MIYLTILGQVALLVQQVIAHAVDQEVDLIQIQKIGRKYLHHY